MSYIRVKCDKCDGTGRTQDGKLCSSCIASASRGTRLVSIDEAKALLIQKQIGDAKL